MCRCDKIKLIMKLFTKFIFVKCIYEWLIELFLIKFICFNKKVFHLCIVIFLSLLLFENT